MTDTADSKPSAGKAAWAALVAALAVVVFGGPPAMAEGTQSHPQWSTEPRALAFGLDAAGFHFESERRTGIGDDRIEGRFDAPTGSLRFDLAARQPDNGTVLRLDLEWRALLEFQDADGSGGYSIGDTVVQRIALFDREATVVATPLVTGGHAATVSYDLPTPSDSAEAGPGSGLPIEPVAPPGALHLTFTLVPQPAVMEGREVLPAAVAFKAVVERFPYAAADTLLGVEVLAAAPAGMPATLAGQDVRLQDNGFTVASSWLPGPVVTSLADQPGRHAFIVSGPRSEPFESGGAIAASHELRARQGASSFDAPGHAGAYVAGAAAAALLVAAPAIIVRARR